MISWLILLGAATFSYVFFNYYIYYTLFGILVYKVLSDLHLIGKTKFALGSIKNYDIYFSKVKGPYSNLKNHIPKALDVFNKFNFTKEYKAGVLTIAFDDPKVVKEEDCRAVVGICLHDIKNEDFESHTKKLDWTKNTITPSPCVIARFDVVGAFAIPLIIRRFYADLEETLKDKDFIKRFKIQKDKIIVIEICKNNTMEFFIPTGNLDKFDFYSSN